VRSWSAGERPGRGRGRLLLASAIFALALGFAVARVGFCDRGSRRPAVCFLGDDRFYSGAYYPVRALLTGENPSDGDRFMALYPVSDMYPPYLPLTLLIHLPLASSHR